MNFTLDETIEEIRSAVRNLCRDFDDDYWYENDDSGTFPWAFYDAMAQGGWLGLTMPEEYGGGGLGIAAASVLLEEVAASGAAMNGCSALHLTVFGMQPVIKHGSSELRDRTIPKIVDGSLHVCFAVTEPDAGTDTTRISTRATRQGDSYIINGRKIWITKAGESARMLLLTRTTPREECERPTDGMTLFFAELSPDAVEVRPIPKMGRNAVPSYEVFIDNLEVPVEDRIGDEGEGFRYLLDGLNPERILLAHEAVGIGRAALRRAVEYANERVVFGSSIGSYQGLQFPLAESAARLESAKLLASKAAWLYDQGLPCAPEANMAKYLCADAGFAAADTAVQVHGGLGYAREYHVERYFREARLMRIAPISQEMALNYIGHHVLGLQRSY